MSRDYLKAAQLPAGLDAQKSTLQPDDASGKNWIVADGEEYRKRPGLRPVALQPEPEEIYAVTGYQVPQGILAAGEYVIHNQARIESDESVEGGRSKVIFGDNQLVFLRAGKMYSIRKLPIISFDGRDYTAMVWVNTSTNNMELRIRQIHTLVETTIIITSSTTVAEVVAAMPAGTNIMTKTDYTFSPTPASFSTLLASCLSQTDGYVSDTTDFSILSGYVISEVAISQPVNDGTSNKLFLTLNYGQDGNIVPFQFQDEMMFVGKGDALISYDGYRASVAGCIEPISISLTPNVGGGSLTAGLYTYVVRTKISKPSGQVTYGPPVTLTATATLNGTVSVALTVEPDLINAYGSFYGFDVNGEYVLSPRRYNPLLPDPVEGSGTDNTLVTAAGMARYRPQVGEYLFDKTNGKMLIRATDETKVYVDGVLTGSPYSLGESYEIFRSVIGGTLYYKVAECPVGYTYTDGTSDATLATQASYIEKTYTIQRPPDFCIAGCTHQGRLVIVGEYINSYSSQYLDEAPSLQGLKRPFVKNVYWSQPNNEEFSPINNAIMDVTDGGELNACISVNDTLYISGGESMWALQGNLASASSYTVNRIAGAAGTVGNTAITAANGQVFAISRSGLYQLQGGSADFSVGAAVNSLIRNVPNNIRPFIRLITLRETGGLLIIIPGLTFKKALGTSSSYSNYYPDPSHVVENAHENIALLFDPNTQKWSQWSGSNMYMAGGVVEFDGQVWAMPRKDGAPISVLDSNWGKDGFDTPVEMVVKGPWQHEGDIFTDKSFVRLRVIHASASSQNYVLTTKIEKNWVDGVSIQESTLDFRSGRGYGDGAWGEEAYGDPNETTQMMALTNQKALSVRAVFENSEPTEFPSISAWEFEIGQNRKNMKQE